MAYQAITRAQFRALIQEQMGLLGTTFYRDDEINRTLQEALRVWNSLTGYWKTRSISVTIANQAWYNLPSTLTSGMRVSFNQIPLQPTNLADLDLGRTNWESETTTSGSDVPTTPTCWAPASINMVAIWPADAAGGNSLTFDGIASTPILTTDASFLDIGQEEINAIVDYVQHVLMFKEGGPEFVSSMSLLQGFLQQAAKRVGFLQASARYRMWMGIDEAREKRPRMTSDRLGVR